MPPCAATCGDIWGCFAVFATMQSTYTVQTTEFVFEFCAVPHICRCLHCCVCFFLHVPHTCYYLCNKTKNQRSVTTKMGCCLASSVAAGVGYVPALCRILDLNVWSVGGTYSKLSMRIIGGPSRFACGIWLHLSINIDLIYWFSNTGNLLST